MIRIAVVIAAGLTLAGCYNQATGWQKPSASAAQTERDFKECTYEVSRSAGVHSGDGIQDGLEINRLRSMCLELRGYSLKG